MFMESISLACGAQPWFPGLLPAAFTLWMARESNHLLALPPLSWAAGKGKGAERNFSEQSQLVPSESTRVFKNESKAKPFAPNCSISEDTIDYTTSQTGPARRRPSRHTAPRRIPVTAYPETAAWFLCEQPALVGDVAAFQAMSFTLEGKITERAAGKLTVSTEENIVFHVNYSKKTEIKRHDGSQGSEKDLRVGVRIKVEGDLAESGEIESRKIEIESEPASGRQ